MNLIDIEPMRPGWGQVWQGGELSAIIGRLPKPHVVFSLIGSVDLAPAVSVFMEDNDDTILPDSLLLGTVQCAGTFLARGFNVLVHCFEGKFRSTYLDVAIHMAYLRYPYAQALGRVKQMHPIAQMRKGTEAQLRRLEDELKNVVC